MGPGKRGQGIALVLSGLTIANVVGVPAITFLGQQAGWRVAYLAVAAIFALTALAIWLVVPLQPGDPAATMRRELTIFRRPQIWLVLLIGSLGFGGFFAVYTYVAPLVTSVAGLTPAFVPIALVAVGIGMTIGNFVGGRAADRNVLGAIFVCFGIFAVALTGIALTSHWPPAMFFFLFLVGFGASALSPAVQTRLMDVAGDGQTLAAAINHSALNLGNSLGAYLGGVTIAAGLGYLSPAWVGLLLCVPGVALAIASAVLQRTTDRKAGPGSKVPGSKVPGSEVPGSEVSGRVGLDEDAVLDGSLS
jgi:DHA1 family inner membrane transport protein